jgi:PAS domain S-box-containing protein
MGQQRLHFIAIIDILIAISSIVIGNFVFIRKPKNPINQIFYILMYTVAIWCFIEAQSIFSPDLNSFLFWDNFDFMWMLSITILFHFVLTYTNSSLLMKNKYPLLLVYGFAFFSMCIHYFFVIETNAILINGIWYSDYSGFSELLNNLFLAIYSLIALTSLIICIQFYLKSNDKIIKKKTIFIIFGLAVPVIGGIIVDVLIGIPVSEEIIPLTTNHFITGTILFFSYAIWRYDIFSLDIDTAVENIVTIMSDALFLIDNNKKIKMINNKAENFTGYNETELVGKSINTILLTNDQNIVFPKGNVNDIDASLIKTDGDIVHVSISSSLVTDENNDSKGYVIICRDITERRQYEQSLRQEKLFSDSLLNSLPGIFYLFDAQGHFLRWNKNFETATEYSSNELKLLSPIDLFDFDEKQKLANRIQEVFEKGQSSVEADFLSKTGKKTPYYFTGVRLMIDKQPFCVGVGIDLTDLKQAQQDLQKAHDQLTMMNKDLEVKVEERTREILHLLKQKDDFVNQLGHDLKNPLGPLLNLIPLIEKKNTDPNLTESFNVINRNVQHMKNLVTKTIQLAQLNAPSSHLNVENVNLSEEIRAIMEQNSFLFNAHHIDVDVILPDDIQLSVDRLRFHELLDNVINNAVKYSKHDGGKISLNVIRDNDFYIFSIKDMGIGMTAKQLEHVFDEFYKADSSRHDFDSTGLGMPICKRIIEMHGGRIWVESEGLGKGSTFFFTLPKKPKNTENHPYQYEKCSKEIDRLLTERI